MSLSSTQTWYRHLRKVWAGLCTGSAWHREALTALATWTAQEDVAAPCSFSTTEVQMQDLFMMLILHIAYPLGLCSSRNELLSSHSLHGLRQVCMTCTTFELGMAAPEGRRGRGEVQTVWRHGNVFFLFLFLFIVLFVQTAKLENDAQTLFFASGTFYTVNAYHWMTPRL